MSLSASPAVPRAPHRAGPVAERAARTQDGGREHGLDERQRAVVGLLRHVHHLVPQVVLVQDGPQALQDAHPLPLLVLVLRQNEQ